jgi:hypothetical protein
LGETRWVTVFRVVVTPFFSLLHDCLIQILAMTLTIQIEVFNVFLSHSKYLNISHEHFLRFIIHYLVIQNDRLSCWQHYS